MRTQLFEQDIGPLKRSLSVKTRRFSRISDLALVTKFFLYWANVCCCPCVRLLDHVEVSFTHFTYISIYLFNIVLFHRVRVCVTLNVCAMCTYVRFVFRCLRVDLFCSCCSLEFPIRWPNCGRYCTELTQSSKWCLNDFHSPVIRTAACIYRRADMKTAHRVCRFRSIYSTFWSPFSVQLAETPIPGRSKLSAHSATHTIIQWHCTTLFFGFSMH